MIRELKGKQVILFDPELKRRENSNRRYLMELENEYLLRNYLLEAGRYTGRGHDPRAFGGWEYPTCQLRGHFLGHWLSAAAFRYEETGDEEIRAKTAAILSELENCQQDNGGEWAGPIPEKYFIWLWTGKPVWAPQYTIHKLLMGLTDVYRLMKLSAALHIADRMADWLLRWSGRYSREQFDDILDTETGGMLEVWADLLELTGDQKYRELLSRYYRSRLFDPLLEGRDVLTNMHANTTIPEVLGCARAYEVTGDEKWLHIAESYWKCAVEERGFFATGGQTQGEIWTPRFRLKARLGDKNQEHCTVYNMIRLADFLFRCTGDPAYMQYIEYNLRNGVMAQTYWQGESSEGDPGEGLLTYFLPMKAGSRKDWAGKTDSFFCCHGTMVQANAAWNRHTFYQEEDRIYITLYQNSDLHISVRGIPVKLSLRTDPMNGTEMTCSENNARQDPGGISSVYANRPDFRKIDITPECAGPVRFTLLFRIPEWITDKARILINGEPFCETDDAKCFAKADRIWKTGDRITLILPIGIRTVPLPDDESTVAFRYGPDVLAGITADERILFTGNTDPALELSADTERQWGEWLYRFRTENQDPGISFRRLCDIGYEPYQIYFKIKQK